ncbi:MAG: DUF5320 domain-containing protein [Syntrophomonas sp.]|nr:DUF5320 domain-containing protein [Syntrophomonas sp.]
MPARDGTGPLGRGPMTGRGLGMCIIGADTLRRGARAGLALRRGAALGVVPAMARNSGLGRGPGWGRGIARGLGLAAVLGIGYGCARVLHPHSSRSRRTEADKDKVQVIVEGPEETSLNSSV